MSDISLITNYFPSLSDHQKEQFSMLQPLYEEWNAKINVVSRKDIDALMLHHVLHSLAIAKFIRFKDGTRIADIGTGGGFPGIPLAIMFPNAHFTLVDSIGKKIKVVEAVAEALSLKNVRPLKSRSEELHEKFDFITSRGVTTLPEFVAQTRHLIDKKCSNALPNGILYLKGGDLSGELKPFGHSAESFDIINYFEDPFFEEKKIVHIMI